jgi:hypothetical protein
MTASDDASSPALRAQDGNFQSRHQNINDDYLSELERRCQLWASCPNADGSALKPDAQIVPLETLMAAIGEIKWHRARIKGSYRQALIEIATGRSGEGAKVDLEVCQTIAKRALGLLNQPRGLSAAEAPTSAEGVTPNPPEVS